MVLPAIPPLIAWAATILGTGAAVYGAVKPQKCPEGYVWSGEKGECVMGDAFREAFADTLPESRPSSPDAPLGVPLWGWGAALAASGVAAIAVAGRRK